MADVVRYTPRAEADLFDIWSTIATDNPRAADRLVRRIAQKAARAAGMPGIGSPRPEIGPDARILAEGRYIVIYEAMPDGVLIVAVVHGMRDPDSWLG